MDPAVEAVGDRGAAARGARAATQAAADDGAWSALRDAAADPESNIMDATLAAARAGVTTGEWAGALRDVFGEYRAPTGSGDAAAAASDDALARAARPRGARSPTALGRRIKILVGKPGLDGHSNGAEQIAVRARDAGMDVVYEGIRLTPARIARTAVDEGVHVVGLSILSGSHAELIPTVLAELREAGAGDVPVVVGGIIPPADEAALLDAGVARVYTPKDFEVTPDHGRHRRLWSPSATAWLRGPVAAATRQSSGAGCARATAPRRPPRST